MPDQSPSTVKTLFSYGFRPFFLFGALYASTSMLLWLAIYLGEAELLISLSPAQWHSHELIFGFAPAVIAGFLLTAVANWTGRKPIANGELLFLFLLWVVGRIGFNLSAVFGIWLTALACCAFLIALAAFVAREVRAAGYNRNLKIVAIIGLLAACQIGFFLEFAITEEVEISTRLALTLITLLLGVIGGRIIPNFTKNWLVKQGATKLPIIFEQQDLQVLAVTLTAMLTWSFIPNSVFAGTLLAIAAIANVWRLSRWCGDQIIRSFILLVLHIGFGFIPLGLALLSVSSFGAADIQTEAGIHAIFVGAMSTLMLGVMVRATRGHTGYPLETDLGAAIAFTLIILSALLRIVVEIIDFGDLHIFALRAAQLSWCLAFLCFAVFYFSKLTKPRKT